MQRLELTSHQAQPQAFHVHPLAIDMVLVMVLQHRQDTLSCFVANKSETARLPRHLVCHDHSICDLTVRCEASQKLVQCRRQWKAANKDFAVIVVTLPDSDNADT